MSADTIAVWQWDLDSVGLADPTVLSAEERKRAESFVVPNAGRRFTAGRAAMRETLGRILGTAGAELLIETGPNGKPQLPGGPHFNLSHSGPLALFAVADFAIGIDIEATRAMEGGIARSVFTPAEMAYLALLSAPEREAAFFRGWTRKEAVVKARGGSIADLQAFAVLPETRVAGWQVVDLAAPLGYAAAVAAPRRGWSVKRQGPARGAI